MGRRRSRVSTHQGISPIISTIFLCAITLAAIALIYPIVSSRISAPVHSIAITKVNMIKQGSVLILTVNVKNIGTNTARLYCMLYDSNFNNYTCREGIVTVNPGVSTSFTIQNESIGSYFMVGQEYRVDVYDTNYGRLGEVLVFCTGR